MPVFPAQGRQDKEVSTTHFGLKLKLAEEIFNVALAWLTNLLHTEHPMEILK